MSRLRARLAVLIRLILALGLACAPLSQPMAMAALVAPAQAAATAGCPHHAQAAKADPAPAKPGDCCVKKGSPCHCAMAIALPTAALPMPAPALTEPPLARPAGTVSRLSAPETPPPRT